MNDESRAVIGSGIRIILPPESEYPKVGLNLS